MAGRTSENWSFDSKVFYRWLGDRKSAFEPAIKISSPTMRSVVCLALDDRREQSSSYCDIRKAIRDQGVLSMSRKSKFSAEDELMALRVAISDIAKQLKKSDHPFQLQATRVGRESHFKLIPAKGVEIKKGGKMTALKDSLGDPKYIAKALVRDGGGLPFAGLYSTYRAAARWLSYSTIYTVPKKQYEGASVDTLRVLEQLKPSSLNPRIGVIGLAPGEGLGEVEMLHRLLRQGNQTDKLSIDYFAIDTSDILLRSHSQLIEEKFSDEIESGQLKYVPLVGNLYELSDFLTAARRIHGSSFLANIPVLCTYFGNCLGNQESYEWELFKSVMKAVGEQQNLVTLVGVSAVRYSDPAKTAIAEENYTLSSFWLETPRHLLYDLDLLKSVDETGKPIPHAQNSEFLVSRNEDPVPSLPYLPASGIKGRVYRFHYTLKNRLTTWDGSQTLDHGEKVHLYSIVKYEVDSLLAFIRARGWIVSNRMAEEDFLTIQDGNQFFRYFVFSAFKKGRKS